MQKQSQFVNGQHRCRAIIAADQTVVVVFMVNFGTAFDITDNGASRSASDVLFLAGLSEFPGPLAATTKLYLKECGWKQSVLQDNRFIERWVVEHAELETWSTHYEKVARTAGDPLGRSFAAPVAVLSSRGRGWEL